MGNCLAREDKVIKVMKTDGSVLEYIAPMKVHQILSEFADHAISDTFPVLCRLHEKTDVISGHLYYLLPLSGSQLDFPEKLQYSNREVLADEGSGRVVRIKLVITKQELGDMLKNGGISLRDMVCQLQKRESTNGCDEFYDESEGSSTNWKPSLEGIPEVN